MSTTGKALLASVAVFTICLCSTLTVPAQQAPPKADEKLRMVRYSGDFASFLAQIPLNMGVTIGFEMDPKQRQEQLDLAVDDATMADIMNAVVQARPGYQWTRTGDNIDVFLSGQSNALLEIPVNTFQISDVTATEAIDKLMSVPEVQASLLSFGLQYRHFTIKEQNTKPVKFALNMQGMTVRQVLHGIAKASGSQFWILRKFGGTSIFTITTSPWL
jgi:hypothetical protein